VAADDPYRESALSTYADNANCWWLLATSPGNEIRISFPEFGTERTADWVEVYRCSSASCTESTKILRVSGIPELGNTDSWGGAVWRCSDALCSELAEDETGTLDASVAFTSATGFLKVTFASDGSGPWLPGFAGAWSVSPPSPPSTAAAPASNTGVSITCGGTHCGSGCTSGASSGYIILGWPDAYENSADCWWLLAAQPGHGIQISFLDFDVERSYDYIEVYRCGDASCARSTKILRLTGKSVNLWDAACFEPDGHGDVPRCNTVSRCGDASCVLLVEDLSPGTGEVSSATGFLKVTFAADYYLAARGFVGNWSVFTLPSALTSTTTSTPSTTPALTSTPAPKCEAGQYWGASSVCIDCEPGKYNVRAGLYHLPALDLTCGGANCGSGCVPRAGASSGAISDGIGPYADDASCWWLLSASPGVTIRISFPEFETEENFDWVELCGSASCSPGTLIMRHSGSLGSASVYTSDTGFLKVTFTSDDSATRSGFTGTWSVVADPVCTDCEAGKHQAAAGATACATCGVGTYSGAPASSVCSSCSAGKYNVRAGLYLPTVDLTCGGAKCGSSCVPRAGASSGTISDGPGLHSNNVNCWWLLATTAGAEIRISFPEFELEEEYGYDWVELCSSASCSPETQILKHAGSLDSDNVYTSATGFLKVIFVTDQSVARSGFTGTWSVVADPVCTDCEAGKYSAVGSSNCSECGAGAAACAMPTGSTCAENSGATQSGCLCNAGYTGPVGGACAACLAGKYLEAPTVPLAAVSCTLNQKCGCPDSSPQAEGYFLSRQVLAKEGSSPKPGYDNDARCEWRIAPSAGVVHLNFVSGVTEDGYDFVSVFSCADASCSSPTLLRRMSGNCALSDAFCSSHTFSSASLLVTFRSDLSRNGFDGFKAFWKAEHVCTDCGAGKASAVTGSSSSSNCSECGAGTFAAAGASACGACGAGSFAAAGASACSACGAGTYSAAGASACSACGAGTYSAAIGASACGACGAGSFAAAGASACSACGAGTYSAAIGATGDSACVACPALASSPAGSTVVASCLCAAGGTGPDGGPCAACAAGRYKTAAGSAACSACGAGKYSAAIGASAATTCETVVRVSVALSMTLEAFDAGETRLVFRASIAEAAGVSVDAVMIDRVESVSRRRLLAESIRVEAIVVVASDAEESAVAESLGGWGFEILAAPSGEPAPPASGPPASTPGPPASGPPASTPGPPASTPGPPASGPPASTPGPPASGPPASASPPPPSGLASYFLLVEAHLKDLTAQSAGALRPGFAQGALPALALLWGLGRGR
jgi:hypothetical protein